jgi:large subunit ribosomal protein L25
MKDTILHVDFLELSTTKPVQIGLPVKLTGSSRGVIAGGKLMQVFRLLNCVGLPQDLPEAITIDISGLKIGQSIRVSHLNIPGVQLLDPANAVVVSVKMARGATKPADTDDDDEVVEEAAPEAAATEEVTEA